MSKPKILVCVDFDNTLLDCNTSVEVRSLLGGKELPKEIEALSQVKKGWTAYMRALFRHLAQKHRVTREDYARWLCGLPLVEGMRDLLLQMYESGDCEIVVVSDANQFFVQSVLRHHQINGAISKIFTNGGDFDRDGVLQIGEFQHQTECPRCPPNMCKGAILEGHLSKGPQQYYRTLFVGDGGNDVCPALRLGPNDYVFAREGYRLLRSLEKMPQRDVKATIVPWETAQDIKNVLLAS